MQPALPAFSIIIPTYDRPEQLRTCLKSLARLDYPRGRFEVIIVDDGSLTPLRPVTDAFRGRLDLTLHRQANAGPAAARNTGAARAEGDFFAFIDDDCRAAPRWLHAFATRFCKTPDRLVGGRTVNALPENPFSTASELLSRYLYRYYNRDPERARFFASNNMAVPARLFHKIGGFDAVTFHTTAEDRELCDRWRHYGYRMTYVPDAVAYHAHPLTLSGFCRQHFNYGRGAPPFHRVRAQRGHHYLIPEPPSFYWNLIRFPLGRSCGSVAWLHAALLGLAQAANAAGFFWERFAAPAPASG